MMPPLPAANISCNARRRVLQCRTPALDMWNSNSGVFERGALPRGVMFSSSFQFSTRIAFSDDECIAKTSDEPELPEGKVESKSKLISAGALLAAVLTAVLTGAVSYAYGVVSEIRKTKIAFVDEQIQKLYGPLYAVSQANDAIWSLFIAQRWKDPSAPDGSNVFFDDKHPPTIEQVRRWRRWMRTVYQPLGCLCSLRVGFT